MPKIEKVLTEYARAEDYADSGYSTPGFLVTGGRLLFLQGIAAWDAERELVSDEFGGQARGCFENLKAVVTAAGGTLENVVQMTYYLADKGDLDEFLAIRKEYFPQDIPPSTGILAMLDPLKIELQCIAVVD
jgi:2-iminobutanoate/2-iminopropanoate deaminase